MVPSPAPLPSPGDPPRPPDDEGTAPKGMGHAPDPAAARRYAESSRSASVALPSELPSLRSRLPSAAAAAACMAASVRPPRAPTRPRPPAAADAASAANAAAPAACEFSPEPLAPFLFFRLPAPTGTLRSMPPAVQYLWQPRQKYLGCFTL